MSELYTSSPEAPVLPVTDSETEAEASDSDRSVSPPPPPPIDEDGLRLRRQIAAGETPTIRPVVNVGYVSDMEEADAAAEDTDDEAETVPEETLLHETVFAEGILGATVPVPVWVLLTTMIVVSAYLCLLIGTGILSVRTVR